LTYDTYMDTLPLMPSVLCHLGAPRTAKPGSLAEYGKLREKMIMAPWTSLTEVDFIRAVTEKGQPFYQALMDGRDLMEKQFEKLVWRTQVLAGLDFDVCDVPVNDMVGWLAHKGLRPWLAYFTFSNDPANGGQSYRLLWRVESDLNLTYDECARALKELKKYSFNRADKHALNPTRMFQGTNSGFCHYDANGKRLNLKELAK
jgi:hypothetical protein